MNEPRYLISRLCRGRGGPLERPNRRRIIAANGKLDQRVAAKAVQGVPIIRVENCTHVPVSHVGLQIADPAADHQQIVVAQIIGVEQRDAQGRRLIVEQLQRQCIAAAGERSE